MPRLSKKEKEKEELMENLEKLKKEKILNFIYDSFKMSNFEDERIVKHIIYDSDIRWLDQVEMLMFCKEFQKADTKYSEDDCLIMYRFGEQNNWKIINFEYVEIADNFTREMFSVLINCLQKSKKTKCYFK